MCQQCSKKYRINSLEKKHEYFFTRDEKTWAFTCACCHVNVTQQSTHTGVSGFFGGERAAGFFSTSF